MRDPLIAHSRGRVLRTLQDRMLRRGRLAWGFGRCASRLRTLHDERFTSQLTSFEAHDIVALVSEEFVNVVVSTPAFASERAIWDFILVVADYDEVIENSFKSDNREIGLVPEPERKPGRPAVLAYVRRWSDIIAENKRRLDFVTSSLEFDPSLAEGLAFIREEYAEMIPEGLAADDEPGDTESDSAASRSSSGSARSAASRGHPSSGSPWRRVSGGRGGIPVAWHHRA